MSNFSDFFSAGGGGLTPKFEEFNSSGTFTPSQALIDAGGYIEVFLVAGGAKTSSSTLGSAGGEVLMKKMYLTSTTGCAITIGSGATSTNTSGGNSTFTGSSAGGNDLTAKGGLSYADQINHLSPGWGSYNSNSAGNGVFGYGAGGASSYIGGVRTPKTNSGQGGANNQNGGSGYCLIKWYE